MPFLKSFFALAVLVINNFLYAQNFNLKTEASGLDDAYHSNGVAVADYDLDGDPDVFITASDSFNPDDPNTWNRLFSNNGDGTFNDVTAEAGLLPQFTNSNLGMMGQKLGISWGDYDNDGYPDLFLANLGHDQLFHNQGNGTFKDVTAFAKVDGCQNCYSSSALWWDYDLDGDLDLYVSDWNKANRLYENKGDEGFQDKSSFSGLADAGSTWTSIPIDADNDGWPDLYVVNDFGENTFYVNLRDGTFSVATGQFGLEDGGDGMGVCTGDYNNDGNFDIYLTNISGKNPNPLFTNNGQGHFQDMAEDMGVDHAGWGWGTQFFDCDNDGDEDLYVVNGFELEPGNNYFFRNLLMEETDTFVDRSQSSTTDGGSEARGLEVFDYDMDGDLDLLVANWHSNPYLYENRALKKDQTQEKNWLQVKLEGTVSNRNGFGTILKAVVGEKSYHRYYHGATFFGQSCKPVHFGIANGSTVDELHVTWPNGTTEIAYNIPANQTINFKEQEGARYVITAISDQKPIGETSSCDLGIFPNPWSKTATLTFNLARPGIVDLTFFSSHGKQILTIEKRFNTQGDHSINLEAFHSQINKPGVYSYRLVSGNKILTGQFIKLN